MANEHTRTCYCRTCDKWFDPHGIARHRAMHRDKKEDCVIRYTAGDVYRHEFSKKTDNVKGKRPAP